MLDSAQQPPLAVNLVAAPEAAPGVLYALYEVFCAVGSAWQAITGEPAAARRMIPRIVARQGAPFPGALGLTLTPHATFEDAPASDIVIVPDLSLPPGATPRGRWPEATAWLRNEHARGALVCSVCTGSLMLAEAGLLHEREATTHWGARKLFARHYPSVKLRPNKVIAPADPAHHIVTSGGYASWSELALYLIARYCSRAEATRIAKIFLLGDRSDGQLPFAAMMHPPHHDDAAIQSCQSWIAFNYDIPNPVTRMAERSGLAPRTFKRRFLAVTGYTPIEYVQTLRVEEAKHLLETTALPMEEIAASVGYQDPASFRRLFKRMTAITPARYRQRYARFGVVA